MAGVGPDTFAGVRGRTKPYVLVRARILRAGKFVCTQCFDIDNGLDP